MGLRGDRRWNEYEQKVLTRQPSSSENLVCNANTSNVTRPSSGIKPQPTLVISAVRRLSMECQLSHIAVTGWITLNIKIVDT